MGVWKAMTVFRCLGKGQGLGGLAAGEAQPGLGEAPTAQAAQAAQAGRNWARRLLPPAAPWLVNERIRCEARWSRPPTGRQELALKPTINQSTGGTQRTNRACSSLPPRLSTLAG